AVGARLGDGGPGRGAVWILFLNPDGTVKSHQKISSTQGGFTGILDDSDNFGESVASLGDLDSDGVGDLAVGAVGDDDGGAGASHGAVWVLFIDGGLDGGLVLHLDIKPGSCPNSFNRNSHGVLPVALVGTESFDVMGVDLSTVELSRADGVGGSVAPNEGPPGPHSVFEDVATPFDGELCDCHELGADGATDLSMKFRTDDVVAALLLNDLPAGELVELVVSGALLDGTPFSASDCIRLVPPGTPPGMLAVGSNLPGAWLDVSPLDLQLDGGGFISSDGMFERTFPQTTAVTLTAPAAYHGWVFAGWRTQGGLRPGQSIEITINGEQQRVKAIYIIGTVHPTLIP
ncbi:MAG: integrin alpha, partial [Planctomycetota bacterium]|nr:integrin alpha [Planctomycetota bacterium]